MRPSTASKKKKSNQNKKRASSSAKRREDEQNALSVLSSDNAKFQSTTPVKRNKDKLILCDSVKKIAMIHAYQPKRLKQCLVSNPKSYNEFYYENSGLCMISNLYTVSFIAHFREWRKNLRNKLFKIINMLLSFWSLVELEQVNDAVYQLEHFSKDLQAMTQVVAKQKESQSSKELSELNRKFVEFREYGEQLIQIFKQFCEAIKRISENLQESFDGKKDARICKKEIKQIGQNFAYKIQRSLGICVNHSESVLMNNAEYRINERLKQIIEQAFSILKKIKLVNAFRQKLFSVGNSRNTEQFTTEMLEEVIKVMNEHQQIKIGKPRGSNIQSEKFEEMALKIEAQLNGLVLEFLEGFGNRLEKILQFQYKELKSQTAESCLETNDSRFKLCKKKILLLLKIFSKRATPNIYQKLSNCIKETSENYQEISQIIARLQDIAKFHQSESRNSFNSLVREILQLVENFNIHRNAICEGIKKCMKQKNNYFEEDTRKDQSRLHKLQKLKYFDENSLKKLLAVPSPSGSVNLIKRDEMIKLMEKDGEAIRVLCTEKFPQVEAASEDINQILDDPLLKKFIKFSDDLHRDLIYSFKIYIQFYKKLAKNIEGRSSQNLSKESLEKIEQFYLLTISKCEFYRDGWAGAQFLSWVFDNAISRLLLDFTFDLEPIISSPVNNEFRPDSEIKPNEKCYRKDQNIKNYVLGRKEILSHVIGESKGPSRYLKSKPVVEQYFRHLLKGINGIIEKEAVYLRFGQSVESGCYEPNADWICQWAKWEFSYCIQECVAEPVIKVYRRQALGLLKSYLKRIQLIIKDQRQKELLGNNFVEEMKRKANNIETLLIPFASDVKDSSNRIKRYSELCNSQMLYLRRAKFRHVGIFGNNGQPATFFVNGKPDSFDEYIKTFKSMLKSQQILSNGDPASKFIPFDLPEESQPKPKVQTPIKQHKEPQFILEEDIKQQSSIGDEIGSEFQLSEVRAKNSKIEVESKPYTYYKVAQLASLTSLAQGFKCIKNGPSLGKKLLNFNKLALAFEEKQPNAELFEHLESTIRQLKQNNLTAILLNQTKTSETEEIIQSLLQSIKANGKQSTVRAKKLEALRPALGLIGCTMNIIYDEGPEGNKMIVCKNENNEQYAYAILVNQNPESEKKQTLSDDEVVEIQKLYLRSLFSIPFQKNRSLDQIKRLTSQLRVETCTQTRKNLNKYKEFPVKNGNEIDQKIKKYLASKSKQIKLTSPNTIDYTTYKHFLNEYSQIVKSSSGDVMHTILVNDDLKYPLFTSRNQEWIQKVLQVDTKQGKTYALLPETYRGNFVERANFNTTNVNLGKVEGAIRKQLQEIEAAHSVEALPIVYSVANTSKENIFGKGRASKALKSQKLKEYQIITNTFRVLGFPDTITPKLNSLEKYKQFEDAIEDLYLKNSFQVVNPPGDDQDGVKNYMENATPALKVGKIRNSLVFFKPEALEKIHLALNKLKVEHRLVKFHSKLIGLAEKSDSAEKVIAKILGMESIGKMKFKQNKNKDIQIEEICIYLKFPGQFQFVKRSKEFGTFLKRFFMTIETTKGKQKIENLASLIDNWLQVVCEYPKLPMKISLNSLNQDEEVEHSAFEVGNYKYENSYMLNGFETLLKGLVDQEQERLDKLAKDEEQSKLNSKNALDQKRRDFILERLETQSFIQEEYDEDECIGNISINLSCDFSG